MTAYLLMFVMGVFVGAFAASKKFRDQVITGIKKLAESQKKSKKRRAK